MMDKKTYTARKAAGTIQLADGEPYATRYFLGEPVTNPPIHMAGQRVYRNWVFEDVYRMQPQVQAALLADDHSYKHIKPSDDDKHVMAKSIHALQ